MKFNKIAIIIVGFWSIFACQNETNDQQEHDHADSFDSNLIVTRPFIKDTIRETIQLMGQIDAPPQHLAEVSPKFPFTVTNINFIVGDKVRKGQVVMQGTSLAYLNLQNDYLSTKAKLAMAEQTLARHQRLQEKNVNALKELQKAEMEFTTLQAKASALKQQLQFANAPLTSIEEGNISEVYKVYAPINGKISNIGCRVGSLVDREETALQIAGDDHFHIELKVFEKDLKYIHEGQEVLVSIPSISDELVYDAEIYLVANTIEIPGRYVTVHAHFEDKKMEKQLPLKVGQYLEAKLVSSSHLGFRVPHKAITMFEDGYHIFIKDGEHFEALAVDRGVETDEWVEVIPKVEVENSAEYVEEGVFYLATQHAGGGSHVQ